MKNEEILIRNFDILEALSNSLIEILKNLESILYHLEPLNNYEEKEDDIFTNLGDRKNDIVILSNVIYNNINNVNIILHDFIKTIPPSYTYYSSFYYNDFLMLKEKKNLCEKRDEKEMIKHDQIRLGEEPLNIKDKNNLNDDKLINNNEIIDPNAISINNNLNMLKSDNYLSQNNKNANISNENEYEQIEESLYFSFLIDLEYSNLLYMKKYEEKIKKYLIHMNHTK
ncbi:conserved Plasmodium protein, unknown function [Plasmodium relictum]|uniref:Uncharacterized protein n=1 Tax=Plasmodium relictum TaxID=85471 RepID=A0A1J1HBC1_PLARL|nr:conserved Plasmodium protein, unknown function [Plasmodium relictum]CRH00722.1 conserved Plasmodium protein, unknown function [Plasmodium relictum]